VTPAALLAQAQADGVTLRLTRAGGVKLIGDSTAVETWAPILRPHKPALLALLSDRQADIAEATSERAAICEHDGGLPRAEADALATPAGAYYRHAWSCQTCRHGTHAASLLHRPCPVGAELWSAYVAAAGREVRT
jgi:hypothetical protein